MIPGDDLFCFCITILIFTENKYKHHDDVTFVPEKTFFHTSRERDS